MSSGKFRMREKSKHLWRAILFFTVWTAAFMYWHLNPLALETPKIAYNRKMSTSLIEDSELVSTTSVLHIPFQTSIHPDDGLCLALENPFDRPCLLYRVAVKLNGTKGSPTTISENCIGLCLTQINSKHTNLQSVTAWYHSHPVTVSGVQIMDANATRIDKSSILMIWNDLGSRTNLFHTMLLAIYPLFAAMLQLGVSRDNEILIVDSDTDEFGYFGDLLKLFSKTQVQLLPHYWGQTLHFKSLLIGVSTGSWARSSVNIAGPVPLQRPDPFWGYLRTFIQAGLGCHVKSAKSSTVTIIHREDRGISNLAELVGSLEQAQENQTRVVRLERLTLGEQIETTIATTCLIGMHGAGLTHMVFLRPFSAVLELLPAIARPLEHPAVCYRNLALSLGIPYAHLKATNSSCANSDVRSCASSTFSRPHFAALVERAAAPVRLFGPAR
jgi:capsular polysaccharide biosynthesis protein